MDPQTRTAHPTILTHKTITQIPMIKGRCLYVLDVKELRHYANECPNPRKSQDYVPLCGNCKAMGHLTYECYGPKNEYQCNE